MKNQFLEQARFMLRILPHVAAEDIFALKGGTAINFFVREMPRLSLDIDLIYLPIEPRRQSLERIGEALRRVRNAVEKSFPGVRVQEKFSGRNLCNLLIHGSDSPVKVEPNLVIRGTIHPSEKRNLAVKVEERFGLAVSAQVASIPDLFGGKICAALDRQHPRDLFDIKLLLENEGLTPDIRKAFIAYWVSHDRPMHEIFDPPRKDFKLVFDDKFAGMSVEPVTYEELVEARENLIGLLKRDLTEKERRFVVSVKEGRPEWDILGIGGLEKLPAIQWKLKNIARMDPKKHKEQLRKLREKLGF